MTLYLLLGLLGEYQGHGKMGQEQFFKEHIYENTIPIPHMRVTFQPIKMTGSWVYRAGSWKEATQYYTDILINI